MHLGKLANKLSSMFFYWKTDNLSYVSERLQISHTSGQSLYKRASEDINPRNHGEQRESLSSLDGGSVVEGREILVAGTCLFCFCVNLRAL